jgi:hypothetical protein
MSFVYRMTQGVRVLMAFTQQVDYTLPRQYLSRPMLDTFQQMKVNEQLHSIRVAKTVLTQQPTTPDDLAIAALMHDVGKIRCPLSVYGKAAAVAIEMLAPALYRYGSTQNMHRDVWARPFIASAHHPRWGAEILRELGGSERAVWLVEHHAEVVAGWMDHPHAGLLWRLQQADDTH